MTKPTYIRLLEAIEAIIEFREAAASGAPEKRVALCLSEIRDKLDGRLGELRYEWIKAPSLQRIRELNHRTDGLQEAIRVLDRCMAAHKIPLVPVNFIATRPPLDGLKEDWVRAAYESIGEHAKELEEQAKTADAPYADEASAQAVGLRMAAHIIETRFARQANPQPSPEAPAAESS